MRLCYAFMHTDIWLSKSFTCVLTSLLNIHIFYTNAYLTVVAIVAVKAFIAYIFLHLRNHVAWLCIVSLAFVGCDIHPC
jgi:hypothetical protein